MSANAGSRNSSNQWLRKLAVALRLLGKELRRLKLKRIDLRRADLRLGEKAYASGAIEGQAELVSRLDGVTKRVTQLGQQERKAGSTFGEKAKKFASKVATVVQIGVLQLKRRRILRRLGANLRQNEANSSLAEETQTARAVADRLSSVEARIRELAPQTYPWARRPLLLMCVLLLLGTIAAFAIRHQSAARLAQQRAPAGRSSLSDAQMKSVLSQQQAFQQQLLQMQAEAHRREAEQTQARITSAERQYREQRDRERAEVEKRQREEAQERERAAAAERARVEEKQREEERRIAAEKAKQDEQRQREAQEQRAKAEAVAHAEQQSKQEARNVARAFVQALERNDTRSASSLAIGDEKQLALAKVQHDFARSFVRMQLARAKKFGGDQPSALFDSSWIKALEQVDGNKATVTNGLISLRLEKRGATWQVVLPELTESNLSSVASSLTHDIDEITSKIEKGEYKNDKEAEGAFEAKLTALASGQQAGTTASGQPAPSSQSRSEDSLAVERHIRSRLIGGMTERQIVEISDLIAEKFAPPEVSPIRDRCFKGTGDQRQFDWDMVYRISKGEYVPSARSVAKRLDLEIDEMVPPRAVFKMPLREAKALPPIEEPIHQGPRTPGSLVNEHLETFVSAMLRLADAYLSQRPYTGNSRLSYLKQVDTLKAGDVLYCRYESGDNFFHERPYFFWYRETPPGLEELLRTLPNDHPIRQIGPPLEEAPPTLELAMKANVETADDVKKMIAESKVRAEKEARRPKGTSYERGRELVYKALGVAFLFGTGMAIKEQHDAAIQEEELQKLIAASGGAKVQCPKCNGRKRVSRIKTDLVSTNPYVQGTQQWKDYEQSWPGLPKIKLQSTEYYEKCDRCDGKGWVDK